MKASKRSVVGLGLSFEEWIDHVGLDVLARALRVRRATVRYWQLGRNDPRVDHMRRIKIMSGGVIDYGAMIDRRVLTSRVRKVKPL